MFYATYSRHVGFHPADDKNSLGIESEFVAVGVVIKWMQMTRDAF
jgi:uncharacterized Ntn-hydrolase superfamily protein